MKHDTIRIATALLFGASLVLTSCGDAPQPKAKTSQPASPSVGREYGETLHGAIDQAHEVRRTLEHSNQTLGHADDPEE